MILENNPPTVVESTRRNNRASLGPSFPATPTDGDRKSMPYYDFACPACGEHFEKNLYISERDRTDVNCPRCGHAGAARQLSAPHIGGTSGSRGLPTPPT
jgi:putative FmdB family regulatory protein